MCTGMPFNQLLSQPFPVYFSVKKLCSCGRVSLSRFLCWQEGDGTAVSVCAQSSRTQVQTNIAPPRKTLLSSVSRPRDKTVTETAQDLQWLSGTKESFKRMWAAQGESPQPFLCCICWQYHLSRCLVKWEYFCKSNLLLHSSQRIKHLCSTIKQLVARWKLETCNLELNNIPLLINCVTEGKNAAFFLTSSIPTVQGLVPRRDNGAIREQWPISMSYLSKLMDICSSGASRSWQKQNFSPVHFSVWLVRLLLSLYQEAAHFIDWAAWFSLSVTSFIWICISFAESAVYWNAGGFSCSSVWAAYLV